ncbi:MAG: ornithine carbamoyltransferase, partial [Deltaproteobacteria bacterium]|nr:ornithine carbamoyltransferase [Deltaproteobacteria bacterium]
AVYLSANDMQLGRGETVADTARVLSRYADGIMARVFGHGDIVTLAKYASVPVINGLSDFSHPCQAVADYLTILEHKGRLEGLTLAYIGDANNVTNSLVFGAAKLGANVAVASPEGYTLDQKVIALSREDARSSGSRITVLKDPCEAVKNADVIYSDVWTSMGQEKEREIRLKAFQGYQIDLKLFESAKKDAIFMHCLPAHRGEEVTDDVCDHERSVIFDQAENRLHAQMAILCRLMGKAGK